MQLFEALLSSVFMTRRHNARQLIAGNKNLIFNGNIWNITHQHEVDNEFHCFVGQWNCPVGGNFVNTVDRQLVLATELRGISQCQCPEKDPTRGLLRAYFVINIYIKAAKSRWILVYLSIRNVSLKLSLRAGDCSGHHISAAVSSHKPVDSYLQWQCGPQPAE